MGSPVGVGVGVGFGREGERATREERERERDTPVSTISKDTSQGRHMYCSARLPAGTGGHVSRGHVIRVTRVMRGA
jgi:hypothetical protein